MLRRQSLAPGAIGAILALFFAVPATSSGQAQLDLARALAEHLADQEHIHSWVCGTVQDEFEERAPLAKGTPVYFEQEPRVITVDYEGPVSIRNLTVVGDVKSITFDPAISDTNANHPNQTWKRSGTATIDGNKVSLFDQTFTADEFRLFFQGRRNGFDSPHIFIGALESKVARATERFSIYVRVAPTAIPDVPVNNVSADTAYSSDVINVVIPNYGSTHIAGGGNAIDDTTIAMKVYENFKDTSHFFSIVPRDTHVTNQFFAFHRRTSNKVTGIGRTTFDNTAAYGSNGTLLGVEWYPNVAMGSLETVIHEHAHQWGHFLTWENIAGITRAGHQPSGHMPLITDGETLIGSVLRGDRDVAGSARDFRRAFSIGFPDPPYTFHPLTLYAMGVLPASKVPAMEVFANQGQFSATTSSTPDVGTPIAGGTVAVDIDDIVGEHGQRGGPKIPKKLKRTLVIVSRDAIMSQDEFNYWTWIAKRHVYNKKGNGVTTWDGFGSFTQAMGRKAKLVNNVDPKQGKKLKSKLKTEYPPFGKTDWKVVQFNKTIPTKIKAGKKLAVSGKVIATDRNDFDTVLVRLRKHDPEGGVGRVDWVGKDEASARAEDKLLFMDVNGSGSFTGNVNFAKADKGRWFMEVFLFWPGSGSQFSRASRSVLHVE